MNIKFEKFDQGNPKHQHSAFFISAWSSQDSDAMLPICFWDMVEHPLGVIAYDEEQHETLGSLAVKELSPDGKRGQIGSLIVSPEHRGKGIAKGLLNEVIDSSSLLLPGLESAFAYVNEDSLPVFLCLGGLLKGLREPPYKTNCIYEVDLTQALKDLDPKQYELTAEVPSLSDRLDRQVV